MTEQFSESCLYKYVLPKDPSSSDPRMTQMRITAILEDLCHIKDSVCDPRLLDSVIRELKGVSFVLEGAIALVQPTGRIGNSMTSYSGRFYPLDPRPEDVTLKALAYQLAGKFRWCSASEPRYSVGFHSVAVSKMCEVWAASVGLDPVMAGMYGLLHDAEEGYLADIPSPLKKMVPSWKMFSDRVQGAVYEKFKLEWPSREMSNLVHECDIWASHIETDELAIPEVTNRGNEVPNVVNLWEVGTTKQFDLEDPESAVTDFLKRFYELFDEISSR